MSTVSSARRVCMVAPVFLVVLFAAARLSSAQAAWPQWGQNPQHTGFLNVPGQSLQAKLSDRIFDPFTAQEMAESNGALLMHYQVPLVNGNNVYMLFKTGTYNSCNPPGSGQPFPCGPNDWNTEVWNETDLQWQNGQLVTAWNFATDWTPVPNDYTLGGWEPLFQPALAQTYIYVPGGGGTIYQLDQLTGAVLRQINPFGTSEDPTRFVSGGLTADVQGNIYYNVIQVVLAWPWDSDVVNAWIVKVGTDGTVATAAYTSLLPNAPATCLSTFALSQLPWPPSATAVPPSVPCGHQRPGLNVAPVISNDGSTLYTVSRAHFRQRASYLLALNTSDLGLQWSTSLLGILDDGCNILLPPDGQPDGCSAYGATGLDPTQNTQGAGLVSDQASASPIVTPDDSILFGVNDGYNYGRGHLLKFDPTGILLSTYSFGWDTTPAIFPNNGSYSVILKDNHYDNGSYCSSPTWCPKAPAGPYYITQLDSNLNIQWQFQDPTDNHQHPDGYEWCANAVAVDANGVVYADNEDGYLYAVNQSGAQQQRIFLERAISAGYTPTSMGGDGTIYGENAGHFIAIGNLLASSTALSSSSNPSTYGSSVTFTATVTAMGAAPTGKVTFKSGTKSLGTGTLSDGVATLTTTPTQLAAGTDLITAAYAGDSTHASSTSQPLSQVVNKAVVTTSVTSNPNPSGVNQSVTFTATVSAAAGLPAPSGKVQFKKGSTILATVTLVNGVAALNYTFTKTGSYTINANYQGNANYLASPGNVVQVVQ
ncbi:MAG TPA: Ig-like domain-containing protein [Candidatus Binatia bacterium]|nr:Ig-like domain-containing protein [Candidatus Binatia bacterium]